MVHEIFLFLFRIIQKTPSFRFKHFRRSRKFSFFPTRWRSFSSSPLPKTTVATNLVDRESGPSSTEGAGLVVEALPRNLQTRIQILPGEILFLNWGKVQTPNSCEFKLGCPGFGVPRGLCATSLPLLYKARWFLLQVNLSFFEIGHGCF